MIWQYVRRSANVKQRIFNGVRSKPRHILNQIQRAPDLTNRTPLYLFRHCRNDTVLYAIGGTPSAGLTNVRALFGKKLWGLPTKSKWMAKWPWHTVKTKTFSHVCAWETCAYFQLVCSETFSLFLLLHVCIGNFDLIIFWHTCGCP